MAKTTHNIWANIPQSATIMYQRKHYPVPQFSFGSGRLSHCHKKYHSHSCTRQRISIPCTRTRLDFSKRNLIASWIHWMSISTNINMLGCTRTHGMDHHITRLHTWLAFPQDGGCLGMIKEKCQERQCQPGYNPRSIGYPRRILSRSWFTPLLYHHRALFNFSCNERIHAFCSVTK